MGNIPSKILGKFAGRYPDRVIREAARLYAIHGKTPLVAKELGIPTAVVTYWRSRYAWEKPMMPLSSLPRQWHCDCGQRCVRDLTEKPVCRCGLVPVWAA